jgi:hypothetical protein
MEVVLLAALALSSTTGAGQDNAHVDEFGAGICKPVKWPIVADARFAAKADIDIAQTYNAAAPDFWTAG